MSNKTFFIVTGITPMLIVLLGLTLYPFIMNIYMSLVNYNLVSPDIGKFLLFRNYRKILFDQTFWIVLKNTLIFTFGAVATEFILGIFIANILTFSFEKVKFLRPVITLPMAAASIAVAYAWTIMMEPTVGLVNVILKTVGLESIETFTNPRLVIPTFILVDTWRWVPFMIIIFMGRMMSLPAEPYEAAKIDGASNRQSFFFITLPLMKSVIFFAVMIRVIDSFKIFDEIFIITRGGPGRASETLSILNFMIAFDRLKMGEGAALSIIILILQLTIALLFIKRSGVYSSK